jgi:hypothetical protein
VGAERDGIILRRSLQTDHTELVGLHPANRNKGTDKPTAERDAFLYRQLKIQNIEDQ